MKFKMAPNSLFGILLRSPWWISMSVALAFAAAAHALLPEPYRLVGSMGAAPFVLVGLVSLWKQLRAPSAGRAQAIVEAVGAMAWPEFRDALEQAFVRDGFVVQRLQGAADLSLVRAGHTTLVSARRWKAARHGEESLHALHAAALAAGGERCIYVALGDLSPNAQRYAAQNQVQLYQGAALVQLLKDTGLPARQAPRARQ